MTMRLDQLHDLRRLLREVLRLLEDELLQRHRHALVDRIKREGR